MTTNKHSRRSALKLLLAGSVVFTATACESLDSLPRFGSSSSTDGSELALRVRTALRKHPYTSQLNVSVTSRSEDVVVVKGPVGNQSDIDNLDLVAHQVEGVRHAYIEAYVAGN